MTQAGSGSETLYFRQLSSTTYTLDIEGTDALNSAFWRVQAFGNLSKLEALRVTRCPSLSLVHLEKLPSLKHLTIKDSSDAFCLSEGDGQVGYQFPVESITIEQYGGSGQRLTRLFSHFPNLRSLEMDECEQLTGLGVADLHKRTEALPRQPSISINQVEEAQVGPQEQHLQDVRGEKEIAAAAPSEGLLLLPPLLQLQKMRIIYCKNLVLCLGLLDGKDPALTGGVGLQGLRSLRSLNIGGCPRFLSSYSSSPSCFPFPDSLDHLTVWGAVGTATLLPLSNLTSLTIRGCGDLRGEGLRTLLAQGRLAQLTVCRSPNFFAGSEPSPQHEQGLPSSSSKLKELVTDDVAGLLAAPIRALLSSSLTELHFSWDKEVERFTKEQEEALLLLTSLERIEFWNCDKLQCLPAGLHRLPKLKRLDINSCAAIRSLPKDGLPNSLQELEIDSCPAIRSLPKECLPSSLLKLVIGYCPAIRSLPKVDDLPSSLRELNVCGRNSEELRRHCRKLIGTIPIVRA